MRGKTGNSEDKDGLGLVRRDADRRLGRFGFLWLWGVRLGRSRLAHISLGTVCRGSNAGYRNLRLICSIQVVTCRCPIRQNPR